jgi:hypothetical protein
MQIFMKPVKSIKVALMNLSRFFRAMALVALLTSGFGGCQKEFPQEKVLFDFESDAELDELHWKCHTLFSLSEEFASHGSKCLRMELFPSSYPGVAPRIKDSDWSKFKALAFDVFNPEYKDIELTVRIDDKKDYPEYEDRYNRAFRLRKGENQIKIAMDSLVTSGTRRKLDARTIHRLIVFLVYPPVKTELYLDYIRLLK